jgi:hypothetical protein
MTMLSLSLGCLKVYLVPQMITIQKKKIGKCIYDYHQSVEEIQSFWDM